MSAWVWFCSLLTFQRRYTPSAIEDILLGQSKYICSENGVFVIRGLSLEFGEKNPYNICLTSADEHHYLYTKNLWHATKNYLKMRFERKKYLNRLIAGRGNGMVKIVTGVTSSAESRWLQRKNSLTSLPTDGSWHRKAYGHPCLLFIKNYQKIIFYCLTGL